MLCFKYPVYILFNSPTRGCLITFFLRDQRSEDPCEKENFGHWLVATSMKRKVKGYERENEQNGKWEGRKERIEERSFIEIDPNLIYEHLNTT